MIGASSVCSVIAGLSIISPDVRAQIVNAMAGDSMGQLGAMAFRMLDFAHRFVHLANDYRLDNTPMGGFAILAAVLAFMMFRT